MSNWETFWAALGLTFPEERPAGKSSEAGVFFSLKKLREATSSIPCMRSANALAPLVIFPEGTKTNGLGIIDIEQDIISIIVQAAVSEKLRVTSIRFDHEFTYFSPYNTTDRLGLRHFMSTISQFSSKYFVQFYFNLENELKQLQSGQEQTDFIKRSLMIRRKEQSMSSLNWRSHVEFLKLWAMKDAKKYD